MPEVTVNNDIAAAMGAKIELAGPARGMYLIIGTDLLPDKTVDTAGGEIVLRLKGNKILATLPFAGYLYLRDDDRISHIGPVSVDIKRLTSVAEMLAKIPERKRK